MPPAAISRSSTYLPKICGNIRTAHASAALFLSLLSGCSAPNAREISVPLWSHTLASCPLPGPANLSLSALGDFPVSNRTSEYLSLDAAGTQLVFPSDTLALEASASEDVSEQAFIGYSERGDQRFDFLLWPEATACELFRPEADDSFPGKLGGQALGYASSTGLVLAAGSNDANSAAIVGALTFDTRTGDSHVVDPRARAVLSQPRAFASVTDFSGAILVAGGEDPIHDSTEPASMLSDTAELYDPTTQSFSPDAISLAEPVTRHAAVTLRSGETALFGGRNNAAQAGTFVQVVSPTTRVAKLLDPLSAGRNSPSALRLDDDRILIGGGTDEDGHPVATLEWRDVDASSLPDPFAGGVSLPARFDRAFVALPGGAALALGGCADRAPVGAEDCSEWCAHGCPPTPDPSTQQSYDAFWLAPDGTAEQLDFPLIAPQPILFLGSDGRPWLVAAGLDDQGNADPQHRALYRFDPWQKQFTLVDVDLGFDDTLDPTRVVSTGPDAFAWFGSDATGAFLRGARFGTRSAFASDVGLVSQSEDFVRPSHLAPDHAPSTDVSYDATAPSLSFSMPSAAGVTCVWIADAKYGDFSGQIAFSSGNAPALHVGRTLIDVGATCALPAIASGVTQLNVRRVGATLTLSGGGASSSCQLDDADARIPFGVCQTTAGATMVTSIQLTRGD